MDTIVAAAAARRRKLAKKIGDGLVVLTAAAAALRSRDTFYAPYRQDSYFYYLTACQEADSAVILTAAGGRLQDEYFFCRKRDALAQRWEGERLNPQTAKRRLGFAQTMDIERLPAMLSELARGHERLFYPLADAADGLEQMVKSLMRARSNGQRRGVRLPSQLMDVTVALGEMRLVKDACEINLLRDACRVSANGVMAAMQAACRADYEYQIEAELIAVYRRSGGTHAFPPIVASGKNACVLHYTHNRARVRPKQGVLVDSGCELQGYAGDITRSFPADGIWRAGFAEVYAVVLAAQQAAIRAAKPGATLQSLEKAALAQLVEGLRALKLCRESKEAIMEKKLYRRFYMHGIGHWLGLDVHDVGEVCEPGGSRPRLLKPGMALTVEPGLYIGSDKNIPAPLRNIGVRIEDNLLITKTGHEVLTAAAAKTPQDISAWMRRR